MQKPLSIVSWNINGYTQNVHDWLRSFMDTSYPDIIFLSETKRKEEVLANMFETFLDYSYIINSHTPAHLHGVAMLIRKSNTFTPIPIRMSIPVRSDNKTFEASTGRIIVAAVNSKFYLIGSYTPNSGRLDKTKLEYRTKIWDPAFTNLLTTLRNNGPSIWIGDINVAQADIDVSNPKVMCKYAGYTDEERNNFTIIVNSGWIDVWRHKYGNKRLYTWKGDGGKIDYGMRLDNILVTTPLINRIVDVVAYEDVPLKTLSDHVMIGVSIII